VENVPVLGVRLTVSHYDAAMRAASRLRSGSYRATTSTGSVSTVVEPYRFVRVTAQLTLRPTWAGRQRNRFGFVDPVWPSSLPALTGSPSRSHWNVTVPLPLHSPWSQVSTDPTDLVDPLTGRAA